MGAGRRRTTAVQQALVRPKTRPSSAFRGLRAAFGARVDSGPGRFGPGPPAGARPPTVPGIYAARVSARKRVPRRLLRSRPRGFRAPSSRWLITPRLDGADRPLARRHRCGRTAPVPAASTRGRTSAASTSAGRRTPPVRPIRPTWPARPVEPATKRTPAGRWVPSCPPPDRSASPAARCRSASCPLLPPFSWSSCQATGGSGGSGRPGRRSLERGSHRGRDAELGTPAAKPVLSWTFSVSRGWLRGNVPVPCRFPIRQRGTDRVFPGWVLAGVLTHHR